MQKIAKQGQAMCRAFFWVKLCRKKIVTGHGTGKKAAVVGLGCAVR